MGVWRYKAAPAAGGGLRSGEMSGETAADVRASLRRIGLTVIDLKPARSARDRSHHASWTAPLRRSLNRRLRARRVAHKADTLDGLATLIEAGVPMAEALGSIADGSSSDRATRRMLGDVLESVRGGEPLAEAMSHHRSWFDAAEVAMIRAGQHAGELPSVLRSLAERHERSGELSGKLASALTYPLIVTLVGLGVVVFLSTRTLPDLVTILSDAEVDPPALTVAVIGFGRGLLRLAPVLLIAVLAVVVLVPLASVGLKWIRITLPTWPVAWTPRLLRRLMVGESLLSLAEMLRAGVPMAEGLRVLAPTLGGPISGRLGERYESAAKALERGESVQQSLSDDRWFDPELQRLVSIGSSAGELDDMLQRVGERYRRASRRAIDRLAGLLEPAVILALAVGVGVVVMAAILPLIRLREVL